MASKQGESPSDLSKALQSQKPLFHNVVFFSFFINLLVMTPTVYMLEVYDRVVNSRSLTTLAMLTLIVVAGYTVMALLEWVRMRVMHQAALRFDARMGERMFDTVLEANLRRVQGATPQVFNDLRTVREFFYSPALMALVDVPLAMTYIVVIVLINPYMGLFSLVGALLQVGLAALTERDTQAPLARANQAAIAAQSYAGNSLRDAQVIESMGMERGILQRWLRRQHEFLALQASASDKAGAYASLSRFVQLAQASLLLGAGCWLTVEGQFPGGGAMMIVASTLGGRVLAPIVQVIGGWRQVVNARDAYGRLDRLLASVPLREAGMPLPVPKGVLSVENAYAAAPGSQAPILRGVSFVLQPGKVLALIGPSASGKSSLARLLVGVWPAASGKVRLDGVDVHPWSKRELGPHLGYLPQGVELFDGTLAENIARFGELDMHRVEAAARAVGVHQAILQLPNGYETAVGEEGSFLSGGLRQRVGIARAIYGDPRLVVLDEPNSSLDEDGERALLETLLDLKARGVTVVVITHRTSVLAAVDQILILQDGQVKAHGPRDEVLAALQGGAQRAAQAAAAPALAA